MPIKKALSLETLLTAMTLSESEHDITQEQQKEFAQYFYLGKDAYSKNTIRAILSDYSVWVSWCNNNQIQAFPVQRDVLLYYLEDHENKHSIQTLRRRVSVLVKLQEAAKIKPNHAQDDYIALKLKGIAKLQARKLCWNGTLKSVNTTLSRA